MENKKTYLTSDLATELGVPRTTVNDWLNRYGAYLESEARGKRRAYTENSLAVLREVMELRDRGTPAFEIENELARRHGLRPEVAAPPENPPPAAPAGKPGLPDAGAVPATPAMTTAPAVTNALLRLADDDFQKLFRSLESREEQRRSATRRFWWLLFALILLLALALGLPLLLFTGKVLQQLEAERRLAAERYETVDRANQALNDNLASTRQALDTLRTEQKNRLEAVRESAAQQEARQRAELEKLTVQLDRSRDDYIATVKQLQAELTAQREKADAAIKQLENDSDGRHEVEIAKLRSEFARQQQALLDRLERETENRVRAERAASEAALRLENRNHQPPPATPGPGEKKP